MFKWFNESLDYQTATTKCQDHGGTLAAQILRQTDAAKYDTLARVKFVCVLTFFRPCAIVIFESYRPLSVPQISIMDLTVKLTSFALLQEIFADSKSLNI